MKITIRVLCFLILPLLFLTGSGPDEIVYVTNTGRVYHLETCSSLRASKIAVTLLDAARSEYGPCSRCGPPLLDLDAELLEPRDAVLYRVNTAGLEKSGAADLGRMLQAEVVGHVDGDTVRVRISNPPAGLSIVETIRLLGVDTPETVHPNREAERFGQEASDFTKEALLGKMVYLAFDWDLRDRYGRLLAYIYTPRQDRRQDPGQGLCFNAVLIQEGYGHAYLRFPFQFMEEFRLLEQEARREGRGMWSFSR